MSWVAQRCRLATLLFVVLCSHIAAHAAPLDWLRAQQQADGGFATNDASLATPAQTAAEAVSTFALADVSSPAALAAAAFLQTASEANTESLARLIAARSMLGLDTAAALDALLAHQNADGGFGHVAGFESSALDTAYAVEALFLAGQGATPAAQAGLVWLVARQRPDGYWQDAESASQVFLTATAMRALWHYRHVAPHARPALDRARDYLLGQRDSAGLWPETHESALALIALSPYLPDASPIAISVAALEGAQAADESWGHDPYTTALVIRALGAAKRSQPNPDYAGVIAHIVDAQTGAGMPADVRLSGPTNTQVTANASGALTATNLLAGRYTVEVAFGDYTPITTAFDLAPGETLDLGVLQMLKAQATTGTVTGTVSDSSTGRPLVGAQVSLGSISALTDANGLYQLSGVAPALVIITVSFNGYVATSAAANVLAGTVLIFSPALSPAGAGQALYGQVLDGNTSAPLAGVTLSAVGAAVQTDAQGNYRLTGLGTGTVQVTASLAGYDTVTATVALSEGASVRFSPKLYPQNTTPPGANVYGVTGVVLDAGTNDPIVNASVVARFGATTQTSTSDGAGRFATTNAVAPPGEMTFTHAAYETSSLSLSTAGLYRWAGQQCVAPVEGASPDQTAAQIVDAINAQAKACGQSAPCMDAVNLVGVSETSVTVRSQCSSTTYVLPLTFAGQSLEPLDIGQVRLRKKGATSLLPDLVASLVDRANAVTDPSSLALSGTLAVTVANRGAATANAGARVTAFFDLNRNQQQDAEDPTLGEAYVADSLAPEATAVVSLNVRGRLPFRDAPIAVWVDSAEAVVESKETNNIAATASACAVTPDARQFAPTLKWQWRGSTVFPSHNQVMSIPIVAPLQDTNGDGRYNGDDIPAVVFNTYSGGAYTGNGILRAVSGLDGSELWSVTDPQYRTLPPASIAVGDLDGDGRVEIVAGKQGGGLIAFDHLGRYKWHTPYVYVNWGGPSIVDLDGDGKAEVVIGNQVFEHTGVRRWIAQLARVGGVNGNPQSIVADLNLDGRPEVIAGAAAYSAVDGRTVFASPVGDGFTAVGNFNSDPYPEIVVVSFGRVFLLSHTGQTIWGPVQLPGGGLGGAPTVADMNGDGVPEIGVAGASRYAVFRADGSVLWTMPTRDQSSNSTGSSVFDFDGDGTAEVVYGDEYNLWVFEGATGRVVFSTPNTSGTTHELPVIADVDNDGHADIVVCANEYLSASGLRGIRVFQDAKNGWVNTRKIWNQHSYHITNINDDGSIPRAEQNSWQVHNSYRLNALLDDSARNVPDITTSLLSLVDNGAGIPLSLSARIGNAGSARLRPGAVVAFYQGEPATGVALGTITLPAIDAGTYLDVRLDNVALSGTGDVFVVADANNAVSECDETNNRMQIPPTGATTLGRIAVTLDSAIYAANAMVGIAASITNIGALVGQYQTAFIIEDANGTSVAALGTHAISDLPSGAAAPLNIQWNTGTTLTGNYILRAELRSAAGALLSQATQPFSIVPANDNSPMVSLRVATDRSTYHTTDTVQIDQLVRNLTANALINDATLNVVVRDAAGQAVFQQTTALGQLAPGALRELAVPHTFVDAAVARYAIEASVSAAGGVLATAATSFEVRVDIAKALQATAQPAQASLEIPTPQTCSYRVTNRNQVTLGALSLRYAIVNLESAQLVAERSESIDLAAGASLSQTLALNTGGLIPGTYACMVQHTGGATPVTLAYGYFMLREPPVKIDASLGVGTRGRLLVLLDNDRCDDSHEADDEHEDRGERAGHRSARSAGDDSHDGKPRDCSADPNGPLGAPTLPAQRAFLEALLTQAGWSYTITDTAADFTREFNSGAYHAYALFAERQKLAEAVQKRLREAVFSGHGLLVAGVHDARHLHTLKLNAALGIKTTGSVSGAQGVELDASAELTGFLALLNGERPQRLRTDGAQVLGRYVVNTPPRHDDCDDDEHHASAAQRTRSSGDADHDEDDDHDGDDCRANLAAWTDAVTFNRYGSGGAAFAGQDLLAAATRDGAQGLSAQLLGKLLQRITPSDYPTLVRSVVPLTITLTNRGIATLTTVSLTLPPGVRLIDAAGARIDGYTLLWDLPLAVEEEKTVTLYVRLPDSAGAATFALAVSAPAKANAASHTLTLNVTEPATIAALRDRLDTLTALDAKARKKASQALERALATADVAQAIAEALKATDAVRHTSDAAVKDWRIDLDRWILLAAQYAY